MNGCKGSMRWAKACYGVDLREDELVIVRAERTRGRVKYSTISSNDTSFTQETQRGTACIGCLSIRESFTRWLEAPFSDLNKARKVLPTILDIQLPFALEDCVYHFHNVSRHRNVTRALAVAARLADVKKKIECLKARGIDPLVLDQEGLALWTQSLRELPVQPDDRNSPRVIVCLGKDHSTLVIGQGKEFLSAHSVRHEDTDQTGRILRAQLKSQFEIRWYWTGPGARDSRVVSDLLERLSRDWPGPSLVHDEPGTFLARALATRALLPGPLRCNLRTGPLTHPTIIQRAGRESVKAALLFLMSGLLLCGINWTVRELTRKKERKIDHAFSSLAEKLTGHDLGGAKGEHALKIVSEKIETRENLLRPFLNAFEPSLTGTIAGIIEIGKKHDLRYEMLSLSRDKILLSGTAGDWNSCNELSAYLKHEGFAVKLDRKEALIDERIPFTIASGGANE